VAHRPPRARPRKPRQTKRATAAKKAPSAKKAVKAQETAGPREGSKTAQVVAMLHRKNGATLSEIMAKMGWQKTHRPRVHGRRDEESRVQRRVKPEGGERTYRITK
jgi:hypothetical protein